MKKANLLNAEDAQKKTAEELQKLAQALEKNRELSNDPQEAVEQLAERQEDLLQRLQKANEQAPGENATEQEKQAHQQELRNLAAEQAAIEAGLAKQQLLRNNRRSNNRLSTKQPKPPAICSTNNHNKPKKKHSKSLINCKNSPRRLERLKSDNNKLRRHSTT